MLYRILRLSVMGASMDTPKEIVTNAKLEDTARTTLYVASSRGKTMWACG